MIGVDMTPSMLERANANKAKLGYTNVEFREGHIEALPVEDNTVDTPDFHPGYLHRGPALQPGNGVELRINHAVIPPGQLHPAELHGKIRKAQEADQHE